MEECAVCCCTGYKKIRCIGCQFEACMLCTQKYLLGITSDPHCMNCHCVWDVLFLHKNMGSGFMDGPFREKRATLITARSRRGIAMYPCPSCHYGEIQKPAMTCSSCCVAICGKCMSPKKDKDHVCNEEVVHSLEKIKETTRRCPGCHVPIEKKSGCFQMFCTYCYTAFDWKNGEIIKTDNLHNPHYFDYHQHRNMVRSFYQSINNIPGCNKKRKCIEFFNLMKDIEDQIMSLQCGNASQYLLWVSFYKKGLMVMRGIMMSNDTVETVYDKIQCFKDDLRETLMDYNEQVAGCLQLRGSRLFPPSNPEIVCV